jgi:GTP-binding protein Era
MPDKPFRSGFVSILGRPNVGKSTLLNSIMGEKIVITSDKPQTTRNRIKGIHTIPGAQMVFIDTPGIHRATSMLNRYMVDEAVASIREVDVILFLVEADAQPGSQESFILELLAEVATPVVLVINKIDMVPKAALLKSIERYAHLSTFKEIIPVSALSGDGVERVVTSVFSFLPEGPLYFPDDILTDLPERYIVAEMIREKVFRLTRDEIPYSTAVEVESFKERQDGSLIAISAVINVERDSQKGIIIGRKGEMLKKIGMQSRREIEQFLDAKVYLELFVRVRKDWSEDPRMLKEFGYE